MHLVLNLLGKNLFFLFISFVVAEIIFFALFVAFFISPYKNAEDRIEESSVVNLNEIANSFNELIIKKVTSISTDLLMIYKHMMWIYQTQSGETLNSKQIFNKNSEYYNSLKHSENVIIYKTLKEKFSDTLHIQQFTEKFSNIKYNSDISEVLNVMNQDFLNYIIFYSDDENNFPYTNEDFIIYLQEFIVICKSIILRDLFSKFPKNQFVFLYSNTLIGYPMYQLSFLSMSKFMRYYGHADPEYCAQKFKKECLQSMFGIDNEFTFTKPYFQGGGFLFGICLNIPMKEYIPNENRAALCSNYSISEEITKELDGSVDTTINIVNFDEEKSDIVLYYTSNRELFNFNSTIFQTDLFTKYKMNGGTHSLFHLLYYKLIKYNEKISKKEISYYEEEYEAIIKTLEQNLKGKEIKDNLNFTFDVSSNIPYFDKFGNRTMENSKVHKEKHLFLFSPIYNNASKIDTNLLTFNTTHKKFMFYSCVISNLHEYSRTKEVYWIAFFQKANLFLFFIASTIFGVGFIYNILFLYISFLLRPIKESRTVIEKMIEDIQDGQEETSTEEILKTESQGLSLKKMRRRSAVWQKEIESQLITASYTKKKIVQVEPKNIETKNFENLINFIKKIHKTRSGTTANITEKIFIFNRFQDSIQDNPLQIIDCMLIISCSYYQLSQYSNSISSFKNLLRYIKSVRKEFSSCNSVQNIIKKVTSLKNSYINDYSNIFKTITDSKFQLKIRTQKIYFFYATIELISFIEMKKQNIQTDALTYKLEVSLKFYRKFLKFNEIFKTNQLKVVYSYILMTFCYIEMKEHNEALECIKTAFINLFELQNIILTRQREMDPRTMLIINGSLFQVILFTLAKISKEIGMELVEVNVIEKLMKYSYYSLDNLQMEVVKDLNQLFDNQIPILTKIYNRLRDERYAPKESQGSSPELLCTNYKKKILINVSLNIIKNYRSLEEINVFFSKLIEKYLCFNDTFLYCIFYNDLIRIESFPKFVNRSEFIFKKLNRVIFNRNISLKEEEGEVDFVKCLSEAADLLIESNNKAVDNDMYIFNFGFEEDFELSRSSADSIKECTLKLNQNLISVYTFIIDSYSKPKHDVIDFHHSFHEGLLVKLEKFELIKTVFLSIIPASERKNIFQVNYDFSKDLY